MEIETIGKIAIVIGVVMVGYGLASMAKLAWRWGIVEVAEDEPAPRVVRDDNKDADDFVECLRTGREKVM